MNAQVQRVSMPCKVAGHARLRRQATKPRTCVRAKCQERKGVVPMSGVEDDRYSDVDISRLRKVVGPDYSSVQRNLALELVRVTEAAALEAGRWFGRGEKEKADDAAVQAMRKVLGSMEIDGVVVIGEGAKDEAPMLFCGERVGAGFGPKVDVAVDPLDGTTLVSQGKHGSISVLSVAERGALLDSGPCVYMEKLVVGPEVGAGVVSLDQSMPVNLAALSARLRKPVADLTIAILDRPRHADLIEVCRSSGARIRTFGDGDVAMSLEAARPHSSVDMMIGIGGSPEGVLSACALKCIGGFMQGKLWPRNSEEESLALELNLNMGIMTIDDMVHGDEVYFAATGISDGILSGVRYWSGGATTNSLVMRSKSGTVRILETHHHWNKPGITNINSPKDVDKDFIAPNFMSMSPSASGKF